VYKSCAEVKKNKHSARSGYYTINVRGKHRRVYCDMEGFGGGWTLVVSISASNNNHLQTAENNCSDSLLCVKHSTSNIASRKLSDQDIIALASDEGTFRVDKLGSSPCTAFYQVMTSCRIGLPVSEPRLHVIFEIQMTLTMLDFMTVSN
ncbi:hypothetical protein QZH41_016291, partial [Actinostola sp. cb2023]